MNAVEKEHQTIPPAEQGNTLTLTLEQLQSIVDNAVSKAVTFRPEAPPPTNGERSKKMTNRDFAVRAMGRGRQTQEDVTMVALTIGPASHEPGFFPAVPEVVANRDFQDHQAIIDKVKALGYVVDLRGVEFSARWEPTETKFVGDKPTRALVQGKPEPEEAKSLLQKLADLDTRHSRIWLESWFKGKILTGDRQIDEMAATEAHGERMKVLARAESGDLSDLDVTGIPMGAGARG